ncbi:hypothetical protein AFLA70_97g002751 [Aspergillus flavus AF70]|nr:hypothetical protein AFLA70_97g002751 [Aspergillus flavus AF70]
MVKLCLEDPPIFLKVVIIAISKGIVKVNVAAEWRTDWHRGLGGMGHVAAAPGASRRLRLPHQNAKP